MTVSGLDWLLCKVTVLKYAPEITAGLTLEIIDEITIQHDRN